MAQQTHRRHRDVASIEIATPHGPARARLHPVERPRAALVLGHGAGGGIDAPDLSAASQAARAERISVALVEQAYRVAGRRSPAGTAQLDATWTIVVERLRRDELHELPLIVGGRSLGARVACRTAETTGAIGVLCLAFPLQPPSRRSGGSPPSRLPELDALTLPTLVVQGERDRFGIPPPGPSREVVTVAGDHGLKTDLPGVTAVVRTWLGGLLGAVARTNHEQ